MFQRVVVTVVDIDDTDTPASWKYTFPVVDDFQVTTETENFGYPMDVIKVRFGGRAFVNKDGFYVVHERNHS